MAKIDPRRSWARFDARLEREPDEVVRGLIMEVRNHMKAEILGELEPLMATLTENPVYHFWGHLPEMTLEGQEAVRGFYTDMMSRGGQQFEVVTENIIADTGRVVTEGQVRQLYAGEDLAAMGMTEVDGDALDANGIYLGTNQLITVWPNDGNGKLVGEDIYFGQPVGQVLEKVSANDLASGFDWHDRWTAPLAA